MLRIFQTCYVFCQSYLRYLYSSTYPLPVFVLHYRWEGSLLDTRAALYDGIATRLSTSESAAKAAFPNDESVFVVDKLEDSYQ